MVGERGEAECTTKTLRPTPSQGTAQRVAQVQRTTPGSKLQLEAQGSLQEGRELLFIRRMNRTISRVMPPVRILRQKKPKTFAIWCLAVSKPYSMGNEDDAAVAPAWNKTIHPTSSHDLL